MKISPTKTLPDSLASLPPKQAYLKLLQEIKRRQEADKLSRYKPYPKQAEFHARGATHRERLFRAGNQLGKTWSSAYEIAYHLTGRYPPWWRGRRWARAVVGWAIGQSMQSTRDTMQRLLMGRPGDWGTGTIPGATILEAKRAAGIADALDCVFVRHTSGMISRLYFKSYEKGREALQGETLDFAALDEEPPLEIYTEVLTRTNATKGCVWITFTPLLGMSEVVTQFLETPTPDRIDINMTIEDVAHYTPEERARIIASYPPHEREARSKGVPILGSGRIFPVEEALISVAPMPLPDLWPRIAGIDFGWDHPTALVWCAWDRDANVLYVYDAFRVRETTPAQAAPAIRARGVWIPLAWPHDGLQHEKGSGFQLAQQYRDLGLNLLHEMAQFQETGDEGGHKISRTSVEAGLMGMLQAFNNNHPETYTAELARAPGAKPLRIRVFNTLSDWFQEFRLYHRKDGKVVKLKDDLMSATRYAYMMMRYAATPPDPQRQTINPRRDYDWRVG